MKIWKSKKDREAERIAKVKAKIRTPEEVGKDYGQAAAELGDKAYQIKVLEAEVELIMKRLRELNQEFKLAQAIHSPAPAQPKPLDQAPAAALEAIAQIPPTPLAPEVESVPNDVSP